MKNTLTTLLLLALLTLTANSAFADRYYNSSDTLLGTFSNVKCGTNVNCAQTAGKLVIAAVNGKSTIVASTTTTITAAQCGSTFVSDSADVLTLPEASTVPGCILDFVCGTADDFDVNPNDGTDKIGIAGSITGSNTTTTIAPSAGDAIRCTDIGAGFTLKAVANDLWSVQRTTGIITDVN